MSYLSQGIHLHKNTISNDYVLNASQLCCVHRSLFWQDHFPILLNGDAFPSGDLRKWISRGNFSLKFTSLLKWGKAAVFGYYAAPYKIKLKIFGYCHTQWTGICVYCRAQKEHWCDVSFHNKKKPATRSGRTC